MKAKNLKVTAVFLHDRAMRSVRAGYSIQRWVWFCGEMLQRGFDVLLYEAKHTNSKYVTVVRGERKFKVRFSDHKPIPAREKNKDCDFFVGKTNVAVTNSSQALEATLRFFGMDKISS